MRSPADALAETATDATSPELRPLIEEIVADTVPDGAGGSPTTRPWRIGSVAVTDCWGISGRRELTPSPAAFTAVVGPNGAGKSALLVSATAAAITGQTPGVSPVRHGAERGGVFARLDVNGTEYVITRWWNASGRQSAVLEELDGHGETAGTVKGVSRVNARIVELIGPADLMLASWLAAQSDASRLATMEPKDRFGLLANLFHLGEFAGWQKQFHTQLRAAKDELLQLDGHLHSLDQRQLPAGDPLYATLSDADVLAEGRRLAALEAQAAQRPLVEQQAQHEYETAVRVADAALADTKRRDQQAAQAVQERDALRRRLSEAQQHAQVLRERIAVAEADYQAANAASTQAQAEVADLEGRIAELRATGAALIDAREALQSGHAECDTCGQRVDSGIREQRLEAIETQLERINSQGHQLRGKLSDARSRLDAASRDASELNTLLRDSAAELGGAQLDAQRSQDRLSEVDDTVHDPAQLDAAERSHTRAVAEAAERRDATLANLPEPMEHGARVRLDGLRGEAKRREFVAQAVQDLEREREQLQQQRKQLERRVHALDALDRAAGRKGVPAMLLAERLEDLARSITDILRDAGSAIEIALRLGDTETTSDKVAIHATIDSVEVPYQVASGGQKFLIDLATRAALTDIAARETGYAAGQLYVDEGWGVLDDRNLGFAINLLRRQSREGKAVVTVTHHAEVRDAADRVVEVADALR